MTGGGGYHSTCSYTLGSYGANKHNAPLTFGRMIANPVKSTYTSTTPQLSKRACDDACAYNRCTAGLIPRSWLLSWGSETAFSPERIFESKLQVESFHFNRKETF